MTCDACQIAETKPRWAYITAGCRSCQARSIASIGAQAQSVAQHKLTVEYLGILRAMFGEDWKEGHELVKQWADRLEQTEEGSIARLEAIYAADRNRIKP